MAAVICVFIGGVCYVIGYLAGYCHGGEAERDLMEFIEEDRYRMRLRDAGGKP